MTGAPPATPSRWGLRTKFILWVNLLVVLLVVPTTFLLEHRQRNAIDQEVKKRAEAIARRMADLSTNYLLTYNYVALEQLAKQLAQDQDIEYVIILDKEGTVAAHSQQSDLQRRIPEDVGEQPEGVKRYRLPGAAETDVYEAKVPVRVEQSAENWGTVRVGLSLKEMEADIGRTRGQIALFGLLAVAFGSLASVILARRIVRPIQALARGVAAVGHGDLSQQLPVNTRDELGDLAAAFNEMTRKLAHLRELEERLRQTDRLAALGTMAAGIAHDIRNPLTSISVFAQLLGQHYDDQGMREKFERVVPREIERVQGVIDDMLELARPRTMTLEMLNLMDPLLQALELFEAQIESQQVAVKQDLPLDLPLTLADRRRMHRCFMNIIHNALQAMQHGGELTLNASLVPCEGEADTHQPGGSGGASARAAWGATGQQLKGAARDEIVIRISDTGHGIPEDQVPRIFDPFFTTRESGTGLGMAITHKILEDHCARIAVTSRVRQGTTFTIHFPVRDA